MDGVTGVDSRPGVFKKASLKSMKVLIVAAPFCSHRESNFCLFSQGRILQVSVLTSLEVKRRDCENMLLSSARNVCPDIHLGVVSYCFFFFFFPR